MTTITTTHATPQIVTAGPWSPSFPSVPSVADEWFVAPAERAIETMPAAMVEALDALTGGAPQAGALLLRGLPVGELPPTPASPRQSVAKDHASELVLLAVARRLGEPVGYEPEHGGDLVQNIVPTPGASARQTSTSSRVELMFHTEAAFHPHRPRYLLLLCLRGDPAAATTLASIHEVLPLLPAASIDVLFEERFRTAVDESYLHGRGNLLGAPMAVLTGDRRRPSMVFDADLMVGTDAEADAALGVLAHAVAVHHTGVVLESGDLLVVDNAAAVHGRSPFTPRFDGTDRWLQRTFVVPDLAPSEDDRRGRVVTTRFGV
ncbi:MAG: TauD/TfdA family dioxygenase [Ilumatobacteraceae bacterium]